MKILIIGGGTVGALLIKSLRENAKITVVEKDRDRCERLAQKYEDVEVIHSRAEDTDQLLDLNIEKFDIVFVVTGNQSINIVTSLYLKHNNAKRIICKLNTPNYMEMLEGMEIESICEDIVTAEEFIRKSFSPLLSKLVSSKMVLEKIENEFVGMKVIDIVQKGKYPLVIVRDNTPFFPKIEEIIEEGDELFVLKQL